MDAPVEAGEKRAVPREFRRYGQGFDPDGARRKTAPQRPPGEAAVVGAVQVAVHRADEEGAIGEPMDVGGEVRREGH